jgi:hypothetical protein
MDPTNHKQDAKPLKASKTPKAIDDPWIKLPNESRFRASLIGGVKSIDNFVYLNGLTANLLTRVECDSLDDAVALVMEINEQLDAIG